MGGAGADSHRPRSRDGETATVTLFCAAADGRYTILWREHGGPRLSGAPSHTGFGMRFCETLAATAGIDFQRSWRPEGLELSISTPLEERDAWASRPAPASGVGSSTLP
jgi:two-component sensor histidine kinase